MLRWLMLLLSVALAGLSLLTLARAPEWLDWKFALLAGQFGLILGIAALAIGLAAWFLGRDLAGRLSLAAGVSALLLFTLPAVEAWWIGRRLPASLERAFGPWAGAGPAFSFAGLFHREPARVAPLTRNYPGIPPLDFYRPVRAHAPLVIVIHGGGWDDGARGQIPELNAWLADRGYAVADISYRLAPAAIWPAQREDVLAAVAALQADAGALGIDPGRIVIFGRSAGGQIAEAAAYWSRNPGLRGVVGFYAPADMNFAYALGREDDILKSPQLLRQYLGGTPETAPGAYDSASGIQLVNPGSPPTLLVHGRLDTLVWHRQSVRLARRLAESGVPHLLLSLPWATHALEYRLNSPSGQLATYALAWFLESVTKEDRGAPAGPPPPPGAGGDSRRP